MPKALIFDLDSTLVDTDALSMAKAHPMLGAAGLRGRFRVTVLTEELPRGKPDPLPYRVALEKLGLAADSGGRPRARLRGRARGCSLGDGRRSRHHEHDRGRGNDAEAGKADGGRERLVVQDVTGPEPWGLLEQGGAQAHP